MDPTTAAEAEAFANTEFDYIIIGERPWHLHMNVTNLVFLGGGTSGLAGVCTGYKQDAQWLIDGS